MHSCEHSGTNKKSCIIFNHMHIGIHWHKMDEQVGELSRMLFLCLLQGTNHLLSPEIEFH